MPLPTDPRTPWPLAGHKDVQAEIAEHAAWYAGEPSRLKKFYSRQDRVARRRRWLRGAGGFWQRQATDSTDPTQRPQAVHIAVPGDIANLSADLLFSEVPKITAPADDSGTAAAEWLEEWTDEEGLHNTLLEMAEVAAALGGAFLLPQWDTEVSDLPFLTVVHADDAYPAWSYGRLDSVTFARELSRDGSKVYRHLELHERGRLEHGVYEGDENTLGRRAQTQDFTETEGLQLLSGDDADGITFTGDMSNRLLPVYAPNIKPNRRHRKMPIGRSDFQGIEALFDGIDETYSSWMRDIRLGVARIIVPSEYLQRTPGEAGAFFPVDREAFTALDIDPTARENGGIELIQADIRAEAHRSTIVQMVSEAVTIAGYAPASFRPDSDVPESGRAREMRENRSFRTRGKKERYLKPAIAQAIENVSAVASSIEGLRTVPVFRPDVQVSDSITESTLELANTADALRRAEAASTETIVRMVNPDLDDDQVKIEVQKILDERGSSVPTIPFGDEG